MIDEELAEGPDAGVVRRPVRSFVTRAGRVSNAQQRAIEELLPIHGVPYQQLKLDSAVLFKRQAPVILEIGFGMGETSAALAADHRELDFIGIEVHTPGVGALLKQIGERQLSNVRIIQHDAVEVLEHMIPAATLAGVHVFFPDPLAQGTSSQAPPAEAAACVIDRFASCGPAATCTAPLTGRTMQNRSSRCSHWSRN